MLCRRKEGRDFGIRGSGKKGLTCDLWASGAGKKDLTSGRRVLGRRGHESREKARKFPVKEGKGNPLQKPTPSAASLKSQHEKGLHYCLVVAGLRALDVLRLGQPSDVGRLCRLGRHGGKRPWDIGNILRRLTCIFNRFLARHRARDGLQRTRRATLDAGPTKPRALRSDVCSDQAVTSQAAQRLPVTGQVAHSASMIAQHASGRETTLES